MDISSKSELYPQLLRVRLLQTCLSQPIRYLLTLLLFQLGAIIYFATTCRQATLPLVVSTIISYAVASVVTAALAFV